MIKGQAYIDGTDISDFGICILKGSLSDLLKFPAAKSIDANDWEENDGIEPDLTNIKLENKEVTLQFASTSSLARDNDFITRFTTPGYHNLYIPILDKTWKLRIIDESNRVIYKNGKTISIRFVDDFTRDLIDQNSIASGHGISSLPESMYALDGIYFNEYGIVVEKGRSEIEKMPSLKVNLTRNITTIDGVEYDVNRTMFQSKDIKLECCFLCDTIERFWKNYSSFFKSLTQDGERKLYVGYRGEELSCYYKNTDSFQFFKERNRLAVKFNLTLTLITFRIEETEYLLASETGQYIITEDGLYNILID